MQEVTKALQEKNPAVSENSVYRHFLKEKIDKISTQKKDKAKKFKAYQPDYLHIGITYLPKLKGKIIYLFVAIDRATRVLLFKIYNQKTAENADSFIEEGVIFLFFKLATY